MYFSQFSFNLLQDFKLTRLLVLLANKRLPEDHKRKYALHVESISRGLPGKPLSCTFMYSSLTQSRGKNMLIDFSGDVKRRDVCYTI